MNLSNKKSRKKRTWFDDCQLSPKRRKKAKEKLKHRIETKAKAKEYKKEGINALKSYGGRRAKQVHKRLVACTSQDPCGGPMCSECMRNARLWWCYENDRILRPYMKQGQLFRLTYVPKGVRLAPTKLPTFDLRQFSKRMQRQLRDAIPGAIILGGVDISHNEHASKKWKPHFQPHVSVLIGGVPRAVIEAAEKKLPGQYDDASPRPFKIEAITDIPYAATYCLKMRFNRRVNFDSGKKSKPYFKSWQLAEWLAILADGPLDDRLILCRAKRQGRYLIDLRGQKMT